MSTHVDWPHCEAHVEDRPRLMHQGDPATSLVEANHARFMIEFGLAGGGQPIDKPSLSGVIGAGPIDYHNCIVQAALGTGDVQASANWWQAVLRDTGVPGTWHVGPSSSPRDLVGRLVQAGFTNVETEPGMILEVDTLRPFAVPANLRIEVVEGTDALAEWEGVLGRSFGDGQPEAKWVASTFRSLGLRTLRWQVFLGTLEGIAVASAATFDDGLTVGIYFVAVAPGYRGRGIGTAMTGVVASRCLNAVHRPIVLGSSPMAYRIYHRLGFRDECEIAIVS
jgi:ribosomal protein S18 acetylase RimI-like enzyme